MNRTDDAGRPLIDGAKEALTEVVDTLPGGSIAVETRPLFELPSGVEFPMQIALEVEGQAVTPATTAPASATPIDPATPPDQATAANTEPASSNVALYAVIAVLAVGLVGLGIVVVRLQRRGE